MTLAARSTIAHFRITAKIGEVGMGGMNEARDEKLGRPVALKVLPPELSRHEGFEREARSASALRHPHIVVVHESAQADVRPPDVTPAHAAHRLRDSVAGIRWRDCPPEGRP